MMEILENCLDIQPHEDIRLDYHELLLGFRFDQLNVEIPGMKIVEFSFRKFL